MGRRIREQLHNHYLAAYTLLYLIAAGIVFYFIPLNRISLINGSDGFNQYYPAYVYIGRYLRDFVPTLLREHTIPMFDFTIGYGDDILTTLNYYGLGNVFWLFAALVPAKYASIAYTLSTILQMYLAGVTFSYYGIYVSDKGTIPKLVGATVYVFSAYTLSTGVTFPTFLITLVTFPILIDGVTQLLTEARFRICWRYILALFALSCCGFYFLYMDVIALVVYTGLYGAFHFRGRYTAFMRAVGRVFLQSAIAVGMAAVILLPVILAYLRSERAQEESNIWENMTALYTGSDLAERLAGLLNNAGGESGIGFTLPVIVLIVIFLARYRKTNPVIATEIIVCIIGYFLPAVGSVMNGFSYSADRWFYITHYFTAIIVVLMISELTRQWSQGTGNCMQRLSTMIIIAIYAIWAIATWISADSMQTAICRIVAIGMTLLLLFPMMQGAWHRFSVYCISCTVLIGVINNAPASIGGNNYYKSFKNFYVWHEIEASAFAQTDEGDEFVRTDIYDTALDASLVTAMYSTSSYYSICNSGPYEFLNTRLVSTGTEGDDHIIRGLDGRKALQIFLSVDNYALDRNAEVQGENDLQFPLGFTYTYYMLEQDAESLDPLDRNQSILQLVELEESPASGDLTSVTDIQSEWKSLPCVYNYNRIDVIEDDVLTAQEAGEIQVSLPDAMVPNDTVEYYLLFHGLEWLDEGFERHLTVNGKQMRLRSEGTYAGQPTEFMVKIDISDETLEHGYLSIQFDEGIYRLDSIELRQLDISQYEEYYQQLTETVLENITYQPNRIAGTIDANDDRLLLMTIPYSTGWKCTVDGKETPIYKADQGFSAVVIEAGNHEVVWTYCTPGLLSGACISVFSLLVLLALSRKHK